MDRITDRLLTVEMNVKTIRDATQEEALYQINSLFDSLIINTDRIIRRQKCEHYLNCCSSGGSDTTIID